MILKWIDNEANAQEHECKPSIEGWGDTQLVQFGKVLVLTDGRVVKWGSAWEVIGTVTNIEEHREWFELNQQRWRDG